jgi:periodic tryptophan protein 1
MLAKKHDNEGKSNREVLCKREEIQHEARPATTTAKATQASTTLPRPSTDGSTLQTNNSDNQKPQAPQEKKSKEGAWIAGASQEERICWLLLPGCLLWLTCGGWTGGHETNKHCMSPRGCAAERRASTSHPPMISALHWVPQGASAARPVRYEVSAEEVKEIEKLAAKVQLEDEGKAEAEVREADGLDGELPAYLRMDKYDEDEGLNLAAVEDDDDEEEEDEDEDEEVSGGDVDGAGASDEVASDDEDDEEFDDEDDDDEMGGAAAEMGMAFTDMAGAGADGAAGSDTDEDDVYDHVVKPTDAVLLVANTEEDDCSSLEVQVYDQETGSYYTHHDITLPALPLCLAWMSTPPLGGGMGSYVAIGTFEPAIELWNLDVLDPLEPTACLGGVSDKKKKKKKQFLPGSHKDAVMCLSWNKLQQQVLASGGADEVVKVWDVTTQRCSLTLQAHKNKVQSVQWHPQEAAVLASAAFDKRAVLQDVRSASSTPSHYISLTADPECLLWDPFNGPNLLVGTEDGRVSVFDVRSPQTPLFSFIAHDGGLSDACFSPHARGLLATCSEDKTVKLWDVDQGACIEVACKAMAVGKLFTTTFYPGTPFLLASGGSKGQVALWHTDDEETSVEARFQGRGDGLSASLQVDEARECGELLQDMDTVTDEVLADGKSSKKKKKKKKSAKT